MTKCSLCDNKIHSLMIKIHTCRCEHIYCNKHMHSHDCTFNYQEVWQNKCDTLLPKVYAEKVKKL